MFNELLRRETKDRGREKEVSREKRRKRRDLVCRGFEIRLLYCATIDSLRLYLLVILLDVLLVINLQRKRVFYIRCNGSLTRCGPTRALPFLCEKDGETDS